MRDFFRNLLGRRDAPTETETTTVSDDGDTIRTMRSYRPVGTIGELLRVLGLRVVHFRPNKEAIALGFPTSARATTVVYRPRKDRSHTLEIATAVCSEKDAFDRKFGLKLALGRFMQGQTVKLPPSAQRDSDYDLLTGVFG